MLPKISSMLDAVANSLETMGFMKEAYEIDRISNTVEKIAYGEVENDLQILIEELESQLKKPHGNIKSWLGGVLGDVYRPPSPGRKIVNLNNVGRWLLNKKIMPRIYLSQTYEQYEGTDEQFEEAKKLFLDLMGTSNLITPYYINELSKIVDEIKPLLHQKILLS